MSKMIEFPDNEPQSPANKLRDALHDGIEWSVTEFFKARDVLDCVSELTFSVAVRATANPADDGFSIEASKFIFQFIRPDGTVTGSEPSAAMDLGAMLMEQLAKQPELELYAALLQGLTRSPESFKDAPKDASEGQSAPKPDGAA